MKFQKELSDVTDMNVNRHIYLVEKFGNILD